MLPLAAPCLRRILFTDENAVSIDENRADMTSSSAIIMYFTVVLPCLSC